MGNSEEIDQGRFVVDVLLHEYDTLRAEVLSRATARFQLLGFVGIAAALLGTQNIGTAWRTGLIIATLAGAVVIWWRFAYYIKTCAVRLREIEEEINNRVGERVLVWESSLPRDKYHRLIR